jgi:hypothetical protein
MTRQKAFESGLSRPVLPAGREAEEGRLDAFGAEVNSFGEAALIE